MQNIMPYVVKQSAAKMPSSCWGKYVNVAVIKTNDGNIPAMISKRAKGVVKIVKVYGPCNVGKEINSASFHAKNNAERLAKRLNGEYWGCPV